MFNDQEMMIITIAVIVYFFFLFGFSIWVSRGVKTYDDYNVAGRGVRMFSLILTFVATAIGGSILLGYMTSGYEIGMGQQWANIGIFIFSVVLVLFFAKRIRMLGEKHNMVTLGDFTALRYGEKARLPTVIAVLMAYCSITGMQFVSIATILSFTMDVNFTVGIIIGWVLLTIKTYFGGLKAVVLQDAIHGTVQTVGIFLLFFVVMYYSGGWQNVEQNAREAGDGWMLSISSLPTQEIFVFLLTIGAYQCVRQDLWQRFWAASSEKTMNIGYWISIILSALTGVVVVLIGIMSLHGLNMTIDPTLVYYEVVGEVFPFSLVLIMILALLATVISTADSFFISGASSIVNDIIGPRVKNPSNQKMLFYSRVSVGIVSVIALLLALYIPQLVSLWITGTAMLVSGMLAPIMVGLVWGGVTKIAGLASMWSGLVTSIVWQLLDHPFGLHPVFVGLPLSIIVLFTVTFVTTNRNRDANRSEAL
ncbi:sodium:solute symporter [Geomicrobium sp. JCM 19038]|uniref:sodium:solute symporter family protein n=1 Tax=Geomicrobium sp. JCM 19038 TaxID=1460635 RepID=UPI00045F2E5E|nr:sodium:solute symporter family protein [Geomicrobium sp. JCM 19038]GAK08449.1 hypothetical protein JCM19038_2233 [Geomicrobium sp. JCM 19038]